LLLHAGRGGIARTGLHLQRITQQLAGHLANALGKGRGEQQGLPTTWQSTKQLVQLAGKAQVKHAVGFVEHQRLQLGKAHGILPVQVQQPPGRGHQQIDALAQRHHLRIDADPAIHRIATQRQALGITLYALLHLLGQLTGGYQHQRPHTVGGYPWAGTTELLQQWQGKRSGLAGASLRCSQHVTSLEHGGNGGTLYRRRAAVTQLIQTLQEGGEQPQVGKTHRVTLGGTKTACSVPACTTQIR